MVQILQALFWTLGDKRDQSPVVMEGVVGGGYTGAVVSAWRRDSVQQLRQVSYTGWGRRLCDEASFGQRPDQGQRPGMSSGGVHCGHTGQRICPGRKRRLEGTEVSSAYLLWGPACTGDLSLTNNRTSAYRGTHV